MSAHGPLSLAGERDQGGTRLGVRRLVVEAIAQDTSWECAGMPPVFEQHVPVDDGVMDPLSEFPHAPATGREVMHRILRQRVHGLWIKDRDVRSEPRTEQAPIINAEGGRGLE